MRIAVISDLHMGCDDAADLFGHRTDDFLRFLDFLEAEHEQIVLLGDIYETLTAPAPWTAARRLRRCREQRLAIAERFEGERYRYVHGNHDIVAGRVLKVPTSIEIEADGLRLLFTHGHQFDWIIRRMRWLSEMCAWAGGWLLRSRLSAVWRLADRIDALLNKRSPEDPAHQRWALDLAARQRADIIVNGHTHKGASVERDGRMYMNSGSCAQGRFSFLSIDTHALRFGHHEGY